MPEPRQARPVLVPPVDEERDRGPLEDVPDAGELADVVDALGFVVERRVDDRARRIDDEADRDEPRSPIGRDGGEDRAPGLGEERTVGWREGGSGRHDAIHDGRRTA